MVSEYGIDVPPIVEDHSMMTTALLTLIVAVALVHVITKKLCRGWRRHHLPGPLALPFLGTRWLFWKRYKMNKLHDAYADMFERYGNIFAEILPGGSTLVSIVDRFDIETVLRVPSRRPYRPPTEIVQVYRRSRPDRYASTGLVNEQGEKWFHLRRHLTRELTCPQTMLDFLPDLNSICHDFLDLLDSCRLPDGTVHGFDQLTNRMGLESICALMLGSRLGFLDKYMSARAATLASAVKTHFRAQRDAYYGVPFWKFISTTVYKNLVKCEETIHTVVSELMEEANLRTFGSAQDGGMREIFLKIQDDDLLDTREKKTAVIDFITAGMETLANTLVFLLYLLSKRPDWQQRIHNELLSRTSFSTEEIATTPSIKAAIIESFRLLPIAPFLARLLEAPMTLGTYKLPEGTFLLCHTGAACRREENFWRAKEYCPERWLDVREPHVPSLVAPFGRGKRMCPGKRFVETELNILFAKIMQRWRVEFSGELDIQFDFLLSPKSPVTLRLIEW